MQLTRQAPTGWSSSLSQPWNKGLLSPASAANLQNCIRCLALTHLLLSWHLWSWHLISRLLVSVLVSVKHNFALASSRKLRVPQSATNRTTLVLTNEVCKQNLSKFLKKIKKKKSRREWIFVYCFCLVTILWLCWINIIRKYLTASIQGVRYNLNARFLKVYRYNQLCCNSCYDQLCCNSWWD